ncbi:MAG: amino acid permease [Gemmatimonadales bacterium]|nr:amino acid permease [Gemmatimonadales bacterium]
MAERDSWGERLPRTVGLLPAVLVLVGITIGSGIFRVPLTVAGRLGEPGSVLLVWVFGGVLALLGALTLAELAALFPRSGGVFAYIEEGFGPMPAFLFGWSQLAVLRASALGGISTIFAEYLRQFVPLTAAQVHYVAAALIATVGTLNYLGVQRAAVVTNFATILKYGALVLLVALAFTSSSGSVNNFSPAFSGALSLSALATAIVPVMWAYDGWADLSFMSGEIKDPARTLPRALIMGTLAIIAIYLLVNVAYIYLIPVPEMVSMAGTTPPPLIAATAASRIPILGSAGAGIIAAVVMISTFSSVNGTMMTSPRIFFGMADRGLFFPAIARISPRFKSPSTAIFLATGLGVVYVLFNDFQQLADKFVLGIWPFYILAVGAVFMVRRKQPDLPRPYRVVGYPFVPIIFLLASTGMIVNALMTDPKNTGITFGIILAGIPVFYVARAMGKINPVGGVKKG